MMEKPVIQLRHLSTGYTGKHSVIRVASDINASVYNGELTCLLGANGAGKSTLLRTLSASQPPLAGEVWIAGKRLSDYADKELARLIGIVLTERCEVTNLSVEELVGLGRSPYTGFWGTLAKEGVEIIEKLVERMDMNHIVAQMRELEHYNSEVAKKCPWVPSNTKTER